MSGDPLTSREVVAEDEKDWTLPAIVLGIFLMAAGIAFGLYVGLSNPANAIGLAMLGIGGIVLARGAWVRGWTSRDDWPP